MKSTSSTTRKLSSTSVGLLLMFISTQVSVGQVDQSTRPSRSRLKPTSYRVPSYRASSNRSASSTVYRLDAGDLLAIIVDGVLGSFEDPPITKPTKGDRDQYPVIGYPVVVRQDGTIDLPEIPPVSVRGLTAEQVKRKITKVYESKQILKKSKPNQVMVSLMRKRRVNVTVIHDEPNDLGYLGDNRFNYLNAPRRRVTSVSLPADRADTLNAIAEAGAPINADSVLNFIQESRRGRAPLGLSEGAVVDVPTQSRDFFYTGGLLQGGRYPIPADGANLLQAIALSGGSVNQGLLSASDLYLVRNARGQSGGQPGVYRVDLRRYLGQPGSLNVQPGDVLILRNKPGEALGKAALGVLNVNVGF